MATVEVSSAPDVACWLGLRRVAPLAAGEEAALPPVLVVGSSHQVPNLLRAYHLVGATQDGAAVLSLHDGVGYTGSMDHLSPYRGALACLIRSVLPKVPRELRARASAALVQRWNRDWAVPALCEACAICDAVARDGAQKSRLPS